MALAALAVSAIALVLGVRANRWRPELDRLQIDLSKLQIAIQSRADEREKQADLITRYVRDHQKKHLLLIENVGSSEARNIFASSVENSEVIVGNQLTRKFPYASLQPTQTIRLGLFMGMNSPKHVTLSLRWDDDSGDNREKTVTASLWA